jgi:hypothetical protein
MNYKGSYMVSSYTKMYEPFYLESIEESYTTGRLPFGRDGDGAVTKNIFMRR